jgi:hypothetical protein
VTVEDMIMGRLGPTTPEQERDLAFFYERIRKHQRRARRRLRRSMVRLRRMMRRHGIES